MHSKQSKTRTKPERKDANGKQTLLSHCNCTTLTAPILSPCAPTALQLHHILMVGLPYKLSKYFSLASILESKLSKCNGSQNGERC